MKSKLYILIISLLAILGFGGYVFGAPAYTSRRTILPEITETYELGTSTRQWLNVFSNNFIGENVSSTGIITNSITSTAVYDESITPGQCVQVGTDGRLTGAGASCATTSSAPEADPIWSASSPTVAFLAKENIFTGLINTFQSIYASLVSSTNAFFGNATTTNLAITGITNSFLATDGSGLVIATTTPVLTETDPVWTATSSNYLTIDNASNTYQLIGDYLTTSTGLTVTNFATDTISQWYNDSGYITTTPDETDPVWTATSSNYLTTAVAALTYYTNAAWDLIKTTIVYVTTAFGGDVTGTYDNLQVVDDSHNHTSTTISGLVVEDFNSPNISQWTNDAGYITSSEGIIETDPIWSAASSSYLTTTTASLTYQPIGDYVTGTPWEDEGYLTTETDPVWTATSSNYLAKTEASSTYFKISDWLLQTTDNLTEGLTNLYFTLARAREAISSAITAITYSTSTGEFSLTAGYEIPLTASTTDWQTAYGWGDHSIAGYLLASTASSTYATIASLSDYVSSTTTFGGDVTGTYLDIQVSDNSHNHNSTTISDLVVADFASPNISQWTNDANYLVISDLTPYLTTTTAAATYQPIGSYLTVESDPVWLAASSSYLRIDAASTTFWDLAYSWGDHSLAGYLTTSTGLTVSNFASPNISQWTNDVGYITSTAEAETDPIWTAASSSYLTTTTASSTYLKISDWLLQTTDNLVEGLTNLYFTVARAREAISSAITAITYTTSTGEFSLTSGYEIPTTASTSDWQTAFSWGNHALGGYLTTISGLNISLLTNDSGYITTTPAETDPIFMAASSSLPYLSGNPFDQWLDSTSSVEFLGVTTTNLFFDDGITTASIYLDGTGSIYLDPGISNVKTTFFDASDGFKYNGTAFYDTNGLVTSRASSTNVLTVNATTTNLTISGVTNSLLSTDSLGRVVATSSLNFVPYTGATDTLNLGGNTLWADSLVVVTSGSDGDLNSPSIYWGNYDDVLETKGFQFYNPNNYSFNFYALNSSFVPITTGTTTIGMNAKVDGNLEVGGALSVTGSISTPSGVSIGDDLRLPDGQFVYFGTSDDASISYNGSGLTIKSDNVGTLPIVLGSQTNISGGSDLTLLGGNVVIQNQTNGIFLGLENATNSLKWVYYDSGHSFESYDTDTSAYIQNLYISSSTVQTYVPLDVNGTITSDSAISGTDFHASANGKYYFGNTTEGNWLSTIVDDAFKIQRYNGANWIDKLTLASTSDLTVKNDLIVEGDSLKLGSGELSSDSGVLLSSVPLAVKDANAYIDYSTTTENITFSKDIKIAEGGNGTSTFETTWQGLDMSDLTPGAELRMPYLKGTVYDNEDLGIIGDNGIILPPFTGIIAGDIQPTLAFTAANPISSGIVTLSAELSYSNLTLSGNFNPNSADYLDETYWDLGSNEVRWDDLYLRGDAYLGNVSTSCGTLGTDSNGAIVCNDLGGMFGSSETDRLEARIAELERRLAEQESIFERLINFIKKYVKFKR